MDENVVALNAVVSRNVRWLTVRLDDRWTMQHVADALEMSRPALSHRLNGHTPWTLAELVKLEHITGIEARAWLVPFHAGGPSTAAVTGGYLDPAGTKVAA